MKKKGKIIAIGKVLFPIISIAIVLLLWHIVAIIVDLEIILPKPSAAFAALGKALASGEFYRSVGFTLLRSIISFALAFFFALLVAILSKLNEVVRRLFSPLISIVRSIPTMSIILLALIWLTSQYAPLLIAFIVIFPTLYSGIYSALEDVDKDLLDMAKLYRVKNKYVVSKLIIPTVTPSILITGANALSLNLKLVIASEALAQTAGSIGNLMQISKVYLETAYLFAYTIVAIVLGMILEIFVLVLNKKLVRWK